jgi:hypothetical protein
MRRITAIITALLIVAHSAESQSRDDVIRLAELGRSGGFSSTFILASRVGR